MIFRQGEGSTCSELCRKVVDGEITEVSRQELMQGEGCN